MPDDVTMPEFTWSAVLVGAVLGIIFGASSLYLVLKVGMTVSASIPVAVLSITLFRAFSQAFGFRRATILENNIVQTTGSAGESIAFGVGVTMPALLLLGFEMDLGPRHDRVGPRRPARHPDDDPAAAGVHRQAARQADLSRRHRLRRGADRRREGRRDGTMVFVGFGIAFVHKFLTAASKLWAETPSDEALHRVEDGDQAGLKGAEIGGELAPELLGVGYLIGPRIASLMMAGAVLSYLVLGPLIATLRREADRRPVVAGDRTRTRSATWSPGDLKDNYLRYIGAGAVAAGGIISMFRALPLIVGSIVAGPARPARQPPAAQTATRRTERDLPMIVVLCRQPRPGRCAHVHPGHWGWASLSQGFLGAVMILLFGFLFVTVSSRLTGEIGSSSNPISGMTIATLLLTCLIFLRLGWTGHASMLTALTVAAVVCIASSNGGTTSQDLKTGFLVGATPRPAAVRHPGRRLDLGPGHRRHDAGARYAGTHYTKKDFRRTRS